MTPNEDIGPVAVKSGVAAVGVAATGITLNEWVAIATLAYLALQIGLLLPKYWKWIKGHANDSDPA